MVRLRRGLARIPAAARWCALVAFLNAAVWAVVTPVFHVPDETSHFAYVQYFAETGRVPNIPGGNGISDEEALTMDALRFNDTVGFPYEMAIWSQTQDAVLEGVGRQDPRRASGGGIVETSSQPPLYYALAVAVYHASPWQDVPERVLAIRLMSALIAALTTGFVFMFLRELFAEPWTWTVGALAVAFQPLFGFLSGGITSDNMLFCTCAGLLFGLARAFRRGLTPPLGAGIGVALAAGFLSKLNFVGLVPGALLALALLVWLGPARRQALAAAGLALAIFTLAVAGYAALNKLAWDRAALGGGVENATNVAVEEDAGGAGQPITLKERLGYTWQLYLPRLPFMVDQFDYFPPTRTWFRGFVGNFGWLDTRWPPWVYRAAAVPAVLMLLLAGLALWRRRALVRARWPQWLAFGTMLAGLLVSVGFFGIRFLRDSGFAFEQARYLLPFIPFYAAFVVLAALGAGRRFGRPAGAALVLLAMGHGLFAQLLVISRFYG